MSAGLKAASSAMIFSRIVSALDDLIGRIIGAGPGALSKKINQRVCPAGPQASDVDNKLRRCVIHSKSFKYTIFD